MLDYQLKVLGGPVIKIVCAFHTRSIVSFLFLEFSYPPKMCACVYGGGGDVDPWIPTIGQPRCVEPVI